MTPPSVGTETADRAVFQDHEEPALRDGHAVPRRRGIEFAFSQLLAAVGGSDPQHAPQPAFVRGGQIVLGKHRRRARDEELVARQRDGLAGERDIRAPALDGPRRTRFPIPRPRFPLRLQRGRCPSRFPAGRAGADSPLGSAAAGGEDKSRWNG